LVGNAKKNENQNKSIQNECLVKFALKNVALNELLLIIFHYQCLSIMKAFIKANYQ
jgi:hypothetical protein